MARGARAPAVAGVADQAVGEAEEEEEENEQEEWGEPGGEVVMAVGAESGPSVGDMAFGRGVGNGV